MVSDHQLCSIYRDTRITLRMTCTLSLLTICLLALEAVCWEALPQIPTGRRSQYLVLHGDGGYKYGYDTGDGSAAKQAGDAANQVEGHYFLKTPGGQDIDLKYTAGVQGFVPEGLEKIQRLTAATAPAGGYSYPAPATPVISAYSASNTIDSGDGQAGTGDASYSFSFDTDSYKRQESSDARGNVQGRYSYSNGAGVHDLQYIAGENTGFVATSGSLSVPNGLKPGQGAQTYQAPYPSTPGAPTSPYAYNAPSSPVSQTSPSGSGYAFSYSTGDSSRQESADASGNVQGRYSYQNAAGNHDLSFVAGSQTGFLPTGGSLSVPNGIGTPGSASSGAGAYGVARSSAILPATSYGAPTADIKSSGDGSYAFSYNTNDQSRQESSDASGNVVGRYAYNNNAGSHDLSYVAGSSTGFQVTGGSLAQPNGLGDTGPAPQSGPASVPASVSYLPPVSRASYDNQGGSGDDGSSQDDQANTGDASYSFSVDTGDYKRTESSDASGNVKGSFSYSNAAGNHDLSFVAGANTGFQPTGGSLNTPPGLSEGQLNSGAHSAQSYSVKSSVFSQSSPSLPLQHFSTNSILPSTKTSYSLGNAKIHTYLPPANEKNKFGYIYDTA